MTAAIKDSQLAYPVATGAADAEGGRQLFAIAAAAAASSSSSTVQQQQPSSFEFNGLYASNGSNNDLPATSNNHTSSALKIVYT